MNSEIFEKCSQRGILDSRGSWHKGSEKRLREDVELLSFFESRRLKFSPDIDLRTLFLYVCHGLERDPVCVCGNKLTIDTLKRLPRFCSSACSNQDPEKKLKAQQSFIEKYGVTHNSQIESVKQKKVEKCLKTYGVDNNFKAAQIKEKARESMIKNHGVPHALQSERIKRKSKFKIQKLYGVEHTNQTSEKKRKIRETVKRKYGVDHNSQIPEVKEKKVSTCFSNYGVSHPSQIHLTPEALEKFNDLEWLSEQCVSKHPTEIARELGLTDSPVYQKLAKFNIPYQRKPRKSIQETELFQFIQSICSETEVIQSHRWGKYECDIWVPSLRVAFEYNGVWWHRESESRGPDYHLKKTQYFESKGVHLIHIFENDWLQKRKIIESRIKNLLGASHRIFARMTGVKFIDLQSYKDFLDENHLQGHCFAKFRIGLFSEDELVAVMGVSQPRFTKSHDFEIIRFCTKLGTSVVGGFSKCLKFLEKEVDFSSIVTYADRCWSNKECYKGTGFFLKSIAPPNYKYFHESDMYKMLSRMQFQKHMLSEKLENFDPRLTEFENMENNGYYRIWDCGNYVLEYRR